MILYYFEDIPKFLIKKNYLKTCIKKLINEEHKELGEISIIFCSDKYLLEKNRKYLKHNYLTDIITFDYCVNKIISGDIFISVERINDNANKFAEPCERELFRVIFHGVLHLIGYDDINTNDRVKMGEREEYYLSRFFSYHGPSI
jgi:probable rRNA maturation factor